MPMPIQTLEEFDKVLNVSWYTPEKPREEQTYVDIPGPPLFWLIDTNLLFQVSMCLAIFSDVSLMLH